MRGPGGIPAEPDGWLRAPTVPAVASTAEGNAGDPTLVAVASLPSALRVDGGCR